MAKSDILWRPVVNLLESVVFEAISLKHECPQDEQKLHS